MRWVNGADRDRTGDPLLAKQVLSQLSYRPVTFTKLAIHLPILKRAANRPSAGSSPGQAR